MVTPDGRVEIGPGDGWGLGLRDLRRRGRVRELVGHHGPVVECAVSRDGRRLASLGADGVALVWDLVELRRRLGVG